MKSIHPNLFVGKVNLTNCDRELVHIPNAIQPHGLLLVVQNSNFQILQVSENAETYFTLSLSNILHSKLNDLLNDDEFKKINTYLSSQLSKEQPHCIFFKKLENLGLGEDYSCYIHCQERFFTLEFQPAINSQLVASKDYEEIALNIFRFSDINQSLNYALDKLIQVTDFDRVLAYQFDSTGAGFVSAEVKKPHITSYLGHHFPASDIPRPSHRILSENRIRHIPNVDYTKVELRPHINPLTKSHLDMTFIGSRHISGMCLDFFKNMNVLSSLAIPIIANGALWGFLSGHNYTPKHLSQSAKDFCIYLGEILSLAISKNQNQSEIEYLYDIKNEIRKLDKLISESDNFFEGLKKTLPDLKKLIQSSSFTLIKEEEIHSYVDTLPENALKDFRNWLDQTLHEDQSVFMFNKLSDHIPDLITIKESASGCLGIALGDVPKTYLIWFRPEKVRNITWAGYPEKEFSKDGHNLYPRNSFETWVETVKNTCEPWTQNEIKAAIDIKNSLTDTILNHYKKLSELSNKLKKSNEDLEEFAYIASHDLKEPLRGIHNYAKYLISEYSHKLTPEISTKLLKISELTHRMDSMVNAVLNFSQLNNTQNIQKLCNPKDAVIAAVKKLTHLIESENAKIAIADTFPEVRCNPYQLEEIFLNLIVNSIKYNKSTIKEVNVGYKFSGKRNNSHPIFFVKDNGIGIPKSQYVNIFKIFKRLHSKGIHQEGSGLGLSIAKKFVESHGGQIWLESEIDKGTTFYFTLSKQEGNYA